MILHPAYNSATKDNDIAVIILLSDAELNDNVNIACLSTGSPSEITTNCYATGMRLLHSFLLYCQPFNQFKYRNI